MDTKIGTCSLCGGAVTVPVGEVPALPVCTQCGAVPAEPHGPLIQMQPVKITIVVQ
jgi:hypothetical protein